MHSHTPHSLSLHVDGLGLEGLDFIADGFEECAREVAFAVAGDDGDDVLAGIFRPGCDLEGGCDGGTGRDTDEEAFLKRKTTRGGDGFIVAYGDDFVDQLRVENGRDETGANSLNFVRTGFATTKDGTVSGLDGDDL